MEREVITFGTPRVSSWGLTRIFGGIEGGTCHLDFGKACDLVNHALLMQKIQSFRIRGPILNWLSNFLTDRFFCTGVGIKRSRQLDTSSGVLHGSFGGPLPSSFAKNFSVLLRIFWFNFIREVKVWEQVNLRGWQGAKCASFGRKVWCTTKLNPKSLTDRQLKRIDRRKWNWRLFNCFDLGILTTIAYRWAEQFKAAARKAMKSYPGCSWRYPLGKRGYLSPLIRRYSGPI